VLKLRLAENREFVRKCEAQYGGNHHIVAAVSSGLQYLENKKPLAKIKDQNVEIDGIVKLEAIPTSWERYRVVDLAKGIDRLHRSMNRVVKGGIGLRVTSYPTNRKSNKKFPTDKDGLDAAKMAARLAGTAAATGWGRDDHEDFRRTLVDLESAGVKLSDMRNLTADGQAKKIKELAKKARRAPSVIAFQRVDATLRSLAEGTTSGSEAPQPSTSGAAGVAETTASPVFQITGGWEEVTARGWNRGDRFRIDIDGLEATFVVQEAKLPSFEFNEGEIWLMPRGG
jgi:hypothetical protein